MPEGRGRAGWLRKPPTKSLNERETLRPLFPNNPVGVLNQSASELARLLVKHLIREVDEYVHFFRNQRLYYPLSLA